MGCKKNGTLAVADLALQLMHEQIEQIKLSGELPDHAQYTFDELDTLTSLGGDTPDETTEAGATVLKTRHRTVVTLRYGTMDAREVVRQGAIPDGRRFTVHSSQLAGLVAVGCRYGYDLVAHVGLESFLQGRCVEEIQINLQRGAPSLHVSTSTLDELRRRFLFYLGQVHRQAGGILRDSLQQPGGPTWVIDGTVEPGTPVFFGVQDARSAILLGCRKIPTENAEDMAGCLTKTADTYGRPGRVLHDLSQAMSLACETAFSEVSHHVCHFHFARDVGEDLLGKPQKAISMRLRDLKLQVRLREQRKTQTEWLREHATASQGASLVQRLLRGEEFTGGWNETLGREVLLAFHFWILDYAADGGRQGFPFDPHFLYFHRRLVRGHEALARLLSRPGVAAHAPKALWNLRDQLDRYRKDPQIVAAAADYEIAFQEFQRLRIALRLWAQGNSPMHHGYELTAEEQDQVREALHAFRDEYRQRIEDCSNPVERRACAIILCHVEKYLPQLVPATGHNTDGVRTTNRLEGRWSESKRACRHTQGRRKLTRSFHALPAELMLIPNLRIPEYVSVVLDGSLENLARKFAEANRNAGSYPSWRKSNTSLNLGRIPNRLLRRENFVERLIEAYDGQCHKKDSEAA